MSEPHSCDICGKQAVVRQRDGHYYCLIHNADYNKGGSFEQMKKNHGDQPIEPAPGKIS